MTVNMQMRSRVEGFTLTEFALVILGTMIMLGAAVPILITSWNQYRLILAAQSLTAQMQYARMKSVSSNESLRVSFPNGQRTYQVETASGTVVAGPFYLPKDVSWNSADGGSAVNFPGGYVSFNPTGSIPASGDGSGGRAKIISTSGYRIDIVVSRGGVIRQTSPYKAPPAPF